MARLPGIASLGRTATRLHPRPATVSAFESHVAGPVRWPINEPWPTCDAPYEGVEELPLPTDLGTRWLAAMSQPAQPPILTDERREVRDEVARLYPGSSGSVRWQRGMSTPVARRPVTRRHPRPNPLAVLAQLRGEDVPDLPRPRGADLLQVLWCPFSHVLDEWSALPTVRLYWRREADLLEVVAQPPPGEPAEATWTVRPCRLHPEQIVDYPHPTALPEELRELVEGQVDDFDYIGAFMASGWKVGGYTEVPATSCLSCAQPTTLILTTSPMEYDFGGAKRWQPIEDRHLNPDHPNLKRSQEPTGLDAYRSRLHICTCLSCTDLPIRLDLR